MQFDFLKYFAKVYKYGSTNFLFFDLTTNIESIVSLKKYHSYYNCKNHCSPLLLL